MEYKIILGVYTIKINILPNEDMKRIGFTDYNPKYWYYMKLLIDSISFNLTINKQTLKYKIDILDENFLQPYDYQYILSINKNNRFAREVKMLVDEQLKWLVDVGIIIDD